MEDVFRGAFPRIRGEEASLVLDLMSRIFVYDSANRPSLERIAAHPWFPFYHEEDMTHVDRGISRKRFLCLIEHEHCDAGT